MPAPQYRWPRGLRETILARDGHVCQLRLPGCTGVATHIDHVTSVGEGGAWFDPNNLRGACRHCNCARRTAAQHPGLVTAATSRNTSFHPPIRGVPLGLTALGRDIREGGILRGASGS